MARVWLTGFFTTFLVMIMSSCFFSLHEDKQNSPKANDRIYVVFLIIHIFQLSKITIYGAKSQIYFAIYGLLLTFALSF